MHDKLFPADYLETKETEQHGLRILDIKTDILTNSILRLQTSFIQLLNLDQNQILILNFLNQIITSPDNVIKFYKRPREVFKAEDPKPDHL
jgi:hypothetical protein